MLVTTIYKKYFDSVKEIKIKCFYVMPKQCQNAFVYGTFGF